jgi:hypothetical protein
MYLGLYKSNQAGKPGKPLLSPLDSWPLRAAAYPHQPYFQSGGEEYEESFRVPRFNRPLRHSDGYVTRAKRSQERQTSQEPEQNREQLYRRAR